MAMTDGLIDERPACWWSERVDDEDGEIHYEAHGPRESYVRFEGPNAKADCDTFMEAVREKL
jgi:hypothetical protein